MNTSTNWLKLHPCSAGARSRARALLSLALCASCASGGAEESAFQAEGGWPSTAVDAGAVFGGASTGGGAFAPGAPAPPPANGVPSSWPVSSDGGAISGSAISGGASSSPLSSPINPTTGGASAGVRAGSGGTAGTGASGTGGVLAGLAGFGGIAGLPAGAGAAMPGMPLDPSVKQPDASKLPKVKGSCPNLGRDGSVTIDGSTAQVWVGTKPGPVYFYWHGTGGAPSEVDQALPGAVAGTKSNGGLVASWETSNEQGESTGSIWAVWFTGDFEAADQILACAIEKGIVDTGRIHTSGYSAGGLQAGAMLFARSNYLASGIVYSGGKGFGAMRLQDPSNAPSVLGAHGAQGADSLILDFHDWTMDLEKELKGLGAFAMDCDDNGSHIDFAFGRAGVGGKAMQFLKDHPYNTKPSPYAGGLPAGYPSYCKLVP